MEAKTEAETVEKHCSQFVHSYGLLSLLFIYARGAHLPKGDIAYSGLSFLRLIINQENAPIDLPTCQFDGNIFSVELNSS